MFRFSLTDLIREIWRAAGVDASGRSSIYIEFWYKGDNVTLGQAELRFYNGHKWIDIADLGSKTPDHQWHQFKVPLTDPQFTVSNFKVKFEVPSFDTTKNLYLDELTVLGMK